MRAELKLQCLNIPIKVLRQELPDLKSRKRQDFIDQIFRANPEKLEKLAMYFSLNKTKSIYLFKLKNSHNKNGLNKNNLIRLLNKRVRTTIGQIFIIKQVKVDVKLKEAYLKIKGYSSIRTLKGARPESLEIFREDYRAPFPMYVIIHLDTKHIEFRTKSISRAEISAKIISRALFNSENEFEILILNSGQQNKIQGKVKAKRGSITDLNWAGCEAIHLEGEDLDRTIDEFKRKNLNFARMGASISLDTHRSPENKFSFFSDGRISFKNVDNPYSKIKNVFKKKK